MNPSLKESPLASQPPGASAGDPASPCARVCSWLDERLGLKDILAFALHKTVPQHKHSFWYYWGGLAMFFFLMQVVTGILLLVYYRPGAEAYDSVREITYTTDFG